MEGRRMSEIIVENLRYRYPHAKELALDGLNFSIEKGEFIGVIGENGAGKSTLSQAIMGLVPQFYKGAYGGKVIVDGIEAGKTPAITAPQVMWVWCSRIRLTSCPEQRTMYMRKSLSECRTREFRPKR